MQDKSSSNREDLRQSGREAIFGHHAALYRVEVRLTLLEPLDWESKHFITLDVSGLLAVVYECIEQSRSAVAWFSMARHLVSGCADQ